MKKAMILAICLILTWSLCTAYAVEPDQCFSWTGRVLRVVEVLDGDEVTSIGEEPAEGRYVQVVIRCEGEPLTWRLQMDVKAVLQDNAGTQYKSRYKSGSIAAGEKISIGNMDSAKMEPEFTVQFDLPENIALSDCILIIDGASAYAGIPAELVGTWIGTGMPVNGSSPIELEAVVRADGTGEYVFEQSGYVESYPFTLSAEESSFTVNIPKDNALGITECGGTYSFDGEALTLDITTQFESGRSFSYNAVCTKQEETEEPSDAEAESALSVADAIQSSLPVIQPVVPSAPVPSVPVPSIPVPSIPVPSVTGAGAAASSSGADDADPAEDPAPAPVSEPMPEDEPAGTNAGENFTAEILDLLGVDVYRVTWEALQSGEIIENGSMGNAARGVQQMLVGFGQKISVDGSVGSQTIAALNAVQTVFGLEKTESLDAAGYDKLLKRLLITTEPEKAYSLMFDRMDSDEYYYMSACANVLKGWFATAEALFQESGLYDWEARAAACVQPWPRTGELYRNNAVAGSNTELTVKFNSSNGCAMMVKIYTTDGTLARTMFIGGTGEATTTLPAGIYIIKDGTGTNWYGEEESFGDQGDYEIMTFDNGQQQVELKRNYSSTITVNVKQADPNADSVGADWERWRDF